MRIDNLKALRGNAKLSGDGSSIAQLASQAQINTVTPLIGIKHKFLSYASSIPDAEVVEGLANNTKGVRESVLYCVSEATGAVVKFFESGSATTALTKTNVFGNKVDASKSYFIDRLGFRFGTTTETTDPIAKVTLTGTNSTVAPVISRSFLSKLTISDKTMIENFLLNSLATERNEGSGLVLAGELMLADPIYIPKATDIAAEITLPVAFSIANTKVYIELSLKGLEIYNKA